MEYFPEQPEVINEARQLGVMERIRNMGDGALAKFAIRATAIGASLGMGGVATEMAIDPQPVGAERVADESGSAQQCLPKLLKTPHGISAIMYHAGASHQETIVKAQASGVTGCDNLKRVEKYRLQVEKSGHWIGFEGHWWYPLDLGNSHPNDAHEVETIDHATMKIYDKCVDGSREKARVQFRNTVKNLNTGKIIARSKVKNHPIKTPGC